MKKLFFGLFILSFLVMAVTRCTGKNQRDAGHTYQTLEERYPQWTTLSWYSTDEYTDVYPRMNISIRENAVIVRQDTSAGGYISGEFSEIVILGNMITFVGKERDHRMTAFYQQTDSTMMIKTLGLLDNSPNNVHVYLLLK